MIVHDLQIKFMKITGLLPPSTSNFCHPGSQGGTESCFIRKKASRDALVKCRLYIMLNADIRHQLSYPTSNESNYNTPGKFQQILQGGGWLLVGTLTQRQKVSGSIPTVVLCLDLFAIRICEQNQNHCICS